MWVRFSVNRQPGSSSGQMCSNPVSAWQPVFEDAGSQETRGRSALAEEKAYFVQFVHSRILKMLLNTSCLFHLSGSACDPKHSTPQTYGPHFPNRIIGSWSGV